MYRECCCVGTLLCEGLCDLAMCVEVVRVVVQADLMKACIRNIPETLLCLHTTCHRCVGRLLLRITPLMLATWNEYLRMHDTG